jgi:putative acetyltransferase
VSSTSVRLRRATPADAASIAAVHRNAFGDALPWIPTLHTPEEDLAYFTRVVDEQRTTVIEHHDQIVAFAATTTGWLNHLYVSPSHQGKGYGRQLLDDVTLDHQLNMPDIELTLWTFQRNFRARRFYGMNGFVPVEFTDGKGNEEQEPDLRFVWRSTTQ